MKVNLFNALAAMDYSLAYKESVSDFVSWTSLLNNADWVDHLDAKSTFPTVTFLYRSSQRMVFDVGMRKVICMYYDNDLVDEFVLKIKWIGTLAEYIELERRERQYTVDLFQ